MGAKAKAEPGRAVRLTTRECVTSVTRMFEGAHVVFSEVKDGPSWGAKHRRMDLLAVKKTWSPVTISGVEVKVGRATLYLLDTNLPENDYHFQGLTGHVYGGNTSIALP